MTGHVSSNHVAIRGKDLSVTLGDKRILKSLSFEIADKSRTAIIGPNGSGKTTLLRAIGGLLSYDGSLVIQSREVSNWHVRTLAQELAFVRQHQNLSFDFTVRELVDMGRAPHKHWLQSTSPEDHDLVARALERVDMSGFADRSALTLSGGELQRVFLAQALAQNASILLLDEPTTHLDVHYQFSFMERIAKLREEGRTVVSVVHDLNLAARYADHMLVLHEGEIVADGRPADVLTSEILATVFRMDATVQTDLDGNPSIQYHSPITRTSSTNPQSPIES